MNTMKDYTCGLCGEEFSSNCSPGDIQCTECEARLCPCCGTWFSELGEMSKHQDGQALYEVWRAAVPDYVCNVPAGPWGDLPETIQAGFSAVAAQEPKAAPAVTVEALTRALAECQILVIVDGMVERRTPARPYDLAVQLLTAIDMRLTDDPPLGAADGAQ